MKIGGFLYFVPFLMTVSRFFLVVNEVYLNPYKTRSHHPISKHLFETYNKPNQHLLVESQQSNHGKKV